MWPGLQARELTQLHLRTQGKEVAIKSLPKVRGKLTLEKTLEKLAREVDILERLQVSEEVGRNTCASCRLPRRFTAAAQRPPMTSVPARPSSPEFAASCCFIAHLSSCSWRHTQHTRRSRARCSNCALARWLMQGSSGIIQLVDCFEDSQSVKIVTELCSGGDLQDFIEQVGAPVNVYWCARRGALPLCLCPSVSQFCFSPLSGSFH